MTQHLWIGGQLPGLNEYTKANRANKYCGASLKKQAEATIAAHVRAAGLIPCKAAVKLLYTWYEPTKRRDLDNISFAQKFVQDALVTAGVLAGDGWKHIAGFEHRFEVSHTPGVMVEIRAESEVCDDEQ